MVSSYLFNKSHLNLLNVERKSGRERETNVPASLHFLVFRFFSWMTPHLAGDPIWRGCESALLTVTWISCPQRKHTLKPQLTTISSQISSGSGISRGKESRKTPLKNYCGIHQCVCKRKIKH